MNTGSALTCSRQRVRFVFWSLAILLGALYAVSSRYGFEPDALSYIDLGDAFARGDWGQAVNRYWSPLYGLLLGGALWVLRPSPFWEFPMVHLISLAVYVGALASFDFFLHASYKYHVAIVGRRYGPGVRMLPDWAWFVAGYALFVWTSVRMMLITGASVWPNVVGDFGVLPDILTSLFVYLTAGLVYTFPLEVAPVRSLVLLGVVLAMGYFSRSYMFIIAFVILGLAVVLAERQRRALRSTIIVLLVFLAVSFPLIATLSAKQGRLTVGEGARLNYAYHVNGVPYQNWQGGFPGAGTPTHPTRKLLDHPAVYEFGAPIGGTYPPWYDPAYWYDGIAIRFSVREQARVLLSSMRKYVEILSLSEPLISAAFILLLFAHFSGSPYSPLAALRHSWTLLTLSLAALGVFAWIYFDPRHVAPFIVFLYLGIFALVRVPHGVESRRVIAAVLIASVVLLLIPVGRQAVGEARDLIARRSVGMTSPGHVQWKVADGLRQLGILPGSRVAVINSGAWQYWARLARVKIVAEVPEDPVTRVQEFWGLNVNGQTQVLDILAGTGASVVVAHAIPQGALINRWKSIGNTGYFAYVLRR